MQERGKVLAFLLLLLLVYFWLRFLFHSEPRFPGSIRGTALGVAGGLLMLVPLAYSVQKRVVKTRGPVLRTYLAVHIYAGLIGAILAILHTGHKFDNPLGMLLTMAAIVVVLSGFVGRYLLQHQSRTLRDQRGELDQLRAAYQGVKGEIHPEISPGGAGWLRRAIISSLFLRESVSRLQLRPERRLPLQRAVQIADAIAVLETSIALHDQFKRLFRIWMKFHVTLTVALYLLLATHAYAVVYYGLRWLP